jgi:hypothetical protein
MTITPTPVPDDWTPPPAHARGRYDWTCIQLGTWQSWLNLPDEVTDADAMRACTRIRVAAIDHAKRNGLTVRSSRARKGRDLKLLFERP